MRTHFTFLADPGHGWLIVTLGELAAVGLTEADITPHSHQQGEHLGLEEDLDAPTFLDAYKARFGQEAEIIDDLGSCRSWGALRPAARDLRREKRHENAYLYCHLDQADGITAASMLELAAMDARRAAVAEPKLTAINNELAADCERIAAAIRDSLAAVRGGGAPDQEAGR